MMGHSIYGGGWALIYPLGGVNASPEVSFPLQLVYQSTQDRSGLFGEHWYCPQLESSVVPRGLGSLLWTTPSGAMVEFRADPRRPMNFVTPNGEWRAKAVAGRALISNAEGWQYAYDRGALQTVVSPTGRAVDFVRTGTRLDRVQLRDSSSAATQPLIAFQYAQGGRRVMLIDVDGKLAKFQYEKDKFQDRLTEFQPEFDTPIDFKYDPASGFLSAVGVHRKSGFDVSNFRVEYIHAPHPEEDTAERKKDPASYRLAEDRDSLYSYPGPGTIVLKSKTDGQTTTGSYLAARGVFSTDNGHAAQTLIYYRAPGQPFDGKLRRVKEGDRVVANYRYDRKTGLLSEILDESGVSTFFDYPPRQTGAWAPKPIRVRRGTRMSNKVIAQYAYDTAGRMIAAEDESGKLTRITYTPRGEVASVSDSTGMSVRYGYDLMGRMISVDHNGVVEKAAYDGQGRLVQRTASDGTITKFSYDAQGRLAGVQNNGVNQATYHRDNLGRVLDATDPLGRTTKFDYDENGNLLAEHEPNGSVTRYEYDATGRRTAQIDGNGNRIRFEYDSSGHLTKQTNALGDILSWSYDDSGRLLLRTNGVQTFSYSYTPENRPAHIDFNAQAGAMAASSAVQASQINFFGTRADATPTPAAATPPPNLTSPAAPQTMDYAYDTEGRVLGVSTPDTLFEYVRDLQGRTSAVRCAEKDGKEELLRYRYDAAGHRTGLILAEFRAGAISNGGTVGRKPEYDVLQQTEYTYDGAGRLASIIDNGSPLVRYSYDGAGRLAQKTYDNGINIAFKYDAMSRLSRVEFSGGPISEPKVLSYTWDAANQVTQRSWNGETQKYDYDPSGQLLKVTDAATGSVLESYTYDKAGNMLEKVVNGVKTTMTYDGGNELATRTVDGEAKTTYRYDSAGRMLGYDGGPQNHYGWLDKLTSIDFRDGHKVTYTYWPDGQLASEKVEEAQAKAAADSKGEDILKISNLSSVGSAKSADQSQEHFLWDGLALLRRDDTVYLVEPHPSGGVPVASHSVDGGSTTYYLNDLLGTTLATVCDGEIDFKKLTTFGEPLKANSSSASTMPPSSAQPQAPSAPPQSIPPSSRKN
jgi:YD repeat-containing protein